MVQVVAAITKAGSLLAFTCRTLERLTPEIFLPVYFELVRPMAEHPGYVWAPCTARDIAKLERQLKHNLEGCWSPRSVMNWSLRALKQFSLSRRPCNVMTRSRRLSGWRLFTKVDPGTLIIISVPAYLRKHLVTLILHQLFMMIRYECIL